MEQRCIAMLLDLFHCPTKAEDLQGKGDSPALIGCSTVGEIEVPRANVTRFPSI